MKIGDFYYLKYQIADLKDEWILKQTDLSKLKRQFDILIIDDDEFPLLEDLKRHEYNITYKTDISDLKDVASYQIILCDINGVGRFLGSDNDGAYLSNQIKKKYPDKIVISYTADNFSPKNQKYLGIVDKIIPKGTSVEDWAALLEETIKMLADPIITWKKIETQLLNANIPTKKIALIEQKYVKYVKKNKLKSLEKLCDGTSEVENILNASLPIIIKILKTLIAG